jgi:hypothetical protein
MREKYQEYIDATDKLCRADPLAAAIRTGLLAAELVAQKIVGDAPDRTEGPAFLQVDINMEDCVVMVSCQRDLTSTLAYYLRHFKGDKRRALLTVADVVEDAGKDVRSYTPIPNLPANHMKAFRELCQRWAAGDDLWPATEPAFTFYGHALICAREPAEPPETVRTINLVTRDGAIWTACRARGEEPFTVGLTSGGMPRMVGVVPHCLTRIVNFGIPTPLPVPSTRVGE